MRSARPLRAPSLAGTRAARRELAPCAGLRVGAFAAVTAAVTALVAGCGDIKPREARRAEPATTTAPSEPPPPSAAAPSGSALGPLHPKLAQALETAPSVELEVEIAGCAAYDAAVGPWLRQLDQRLRERDASRRDPRALAQFLTDGVASLAAAKVEDEALVGSHAALTAAVTDLAEAFRQLAAAVEAGDEGSARAAADRLENGGDNLELAVAQVHRQCR